jgi:iron(III) transport system substrate-binding protein
MPTEGADPPSNSHQPKDWFARSEAQQTRLPWFLIACVVLLEIVPFGCHRSANVVTAYIAQDQVYAEPILAQFTKETGIKVRAVFDSEAVKTVAIANRLLAERGHPQCDVFWGNEELRTRQLAAEGVFRETNAWTAVGFRSRRLVINTNRMSLAEAPKSLLELTNAAWRGQVAMAYPLFGTTATHLLALRNRWGDAVWVAWCRALQANRPFVVDGNSVVVQFVARGQARIGLTDSDDIAAAQREDAPVAALPLTAESLLIPNTVAVARGAPHPEPAQKLYEFLQRPEVVEQLVAVRALEGGGLAQSAAAGLQPDWSAVLRDLNPATEALKQIFLK